MEHMLFEVQLCIKTSMFKEKHVFDILIILPSVGGLDRSRSRKSSFEKTRLHQVQGSVKRNFGKLACKQDRQKGGT